MTELRWDGKYDKDGKRVAPVRIPLPFQTVETVNESGQARAHQLDLFAAGRPTEWRNRLIWGDKKYVLPSLLPELAGQVNLIYIDPPFATGADFSFTTTIPDSDESFTKEPSMIEQKAYRDTWGKGIDGYLQWFLETVTLLRDLLAETGAIYVHCDWRLNSAVRLIMDEIFGSANFRNEIAWAYRSGGASRKESLPRKHDSILLYAKSPQFVVRAQTERQYLDKPFMGSKQDANGRYYVDTLMRDVLEGELVIVHEGELEKYNVRPVLNLSNERLDYPTQKPVDLLKLLIETASGRDDLILDCFVGSGTTAEAAEQTDRRWIAADLGRFAIHTTRKRLLSIPNVRPFDVQNLGKYERQAWQVAEFAEGDATQAPSAHLAYRRFMLDLYRAQPLDGYTWLHGLRDGRLVHVGSVDAPVAVGDVQQIVKEFWRVRTSPPGPLSQEERGRQSEISSGSQEERGRQSAMAAAGSQEERGRQSGSGVNAASVSSAPSAPHEQQPAIATTTSVLPLAPRERGPGGEVRSTGIDILGWDFAFELNEVAAQMAADAGVHLKFKRVPREVLEKKAVEQGDIKFFELAALDLRVSQKSSGAVDGVARALGPHVTITLSDFMVPTDDVPEEVVAAVKRWDQWIDYWAVDWDYKGDAFHNMAQTYRTRKDPRLQTTLAHTYDQPGSYTVVVKVIDILGNDTTKTLKVEVT